LFGLSKVRLMPALILTAGGNPVTIWKLTVWDVVSFAKKYADGLWFGPSGSPGEHRTALTTSPGLTGRATCAPVWIVNAAVTFSAASTVIST